MSNAPLPLPSDQEARPRGSREYNFDGLVGPTHNYSGLGGGNLASMKNNAQVSHPKTAALQGLEKMRRVAELGIPQGILPPQRRPHLGYLRSNGYGDTATEILTNVAKAGDPGTKDLNTATSASYMWTANAATVSPSPDTADRRCHFTIANLASNRHRALESFERDRLFRYAFGDETFFVVHEPLPATMPDEGAANHTRLCRAMEQAGIEIFCWGRSLDSSIMVGETEKFMPRQLREASVRLAAQHELNAEDHCLFPQQSPGAIDGGVFHNDVISVGHENVLLIHERAWVDQRRQLDRLREMAAATVGELYVIELSDADLPLADAVSSYLFNSQLVTRENGEIVLIHPGECDEVPTARRAIDRIIAGDNPVTGALSADVNQSMKGGGGPACLRLRVALSDAERRAVRGNLFWSEQLHETLVDWVNRHYRDHLSQSDLAEVRLHEESNAAIDELGQILEIPVI